MIAKTVVIAHIGCANVNVGIRSLYVKTILNLSKHKAVVVIIWNNVVGVVKSLRNRRDSDILLNTRDGARLYMKEMIILVKCVYNVDID